MTKIVRRIDSQKVREIQAVIQECQDAGFSKQDTIFREYKRVPQATLHEHAAANYPMYIITNQRTKKQRIDADTMKQYTEEISNYNKSPINPDEKIIGVPYEYLDIEGNLCKTFFRALAYGENIRKSKQLEASDARIKGEIERKKQLESMMNDKELKKRQDAKIRLLERRINKGKK